MKYQKCTCVACEGYRKQDKNYDKKRKQYLKERTELFGLLAMPQSQLSLVDKERERYLKQKLRMIW